MLRVAILLFAIGAGGLAAWLTFSMKPDASAPAAITVEAPTIQVLVAGADLASGEKLSQANLRWQSWPENGANPGFIIRSARPDAIETLAGSVVRSTFVAGEPVREEKLVRGDSNLLAAALPPGMRAVAIRVSAESSAGGFILPNNRVDVIHTVARQGQGEGQLDNTSRAILSNIRVLAVDQKASEAKGEGAVIGKTATLELDERQTEIINAAQASGVLSLALRSMDDSMEVPRARQQTANSVRILRAGRSETISVR